MTIREDGTDVRLLEQVPLHAPDEEALLADDVEVARADAEHADVGASDGAGQLDPGIERHFLSAEQTDAPAEERIHVGTGRRNAARWFRPDAGEVEDARALQ